VHYLDIVELIFAIQIYNFNKFENAFQQKLDHKIDNIQLKNPKS